MANKIQFGHEVMKVVDFACTRSAQTKSAAVIEVPAALLDYTLDMMKRHGLSSNLESAQVAGARTCTGRSVIGFWVVDINVVG